MGLVIDTNFFIDIENNKINIDEMDAFSAGLGEVAESMPAKRDQRTTGLPNDKEKGAVATLKHSASPR